MFPSPPASGFAGVLVSSLSEVQGEAPATWRSRTFYRLTKPLLVSILLILNLVKFFVGVRVIEDPKTKFLWGLDHKGLAPMVTNKDQLSLTNPHDVLHHGERAANK